MHIRSFIVVFVIVALLAGLTACGGTALPTAAESRETLGSVPIQTAAPESTAEPAVAYQRPQGADSAKALLEKSLDYLHNNLDYSKIADVHDRKATIALILMMHETGSEGDGSMETYMGEADRILRGADAIRDEDPALADVLMGMFNVADPAEFAVRKLEAIKSSFQNGEITESSPNYETFSQILSDWDKGVDYILEHYPDFLDDVKSAGIIFNLEGALDYMKTEWVVIAKPEELARFNALACEYRPENVHIYENGICSLDMGFVADGNTRYGLDMLYYVEDEVYYLLGFGSSAGMVAGG